MAEELDYTGNNTNWSSHTYNLGYGPNPTISHSAQPTYVTTTSRQQPQHSKKDGFSSLFVAETSFPSWED